MAMAVLMGGLMIYAGFERKDRWLVMAKSKAKSAKQLRRHLEQALSRIEMHEQSEQGYCDALNRVETEKHGLETEKAQLAAKVAELGSQIENLTQKLSEETAYHKSVLETERKAYNELYDTTAKDTLKHREWMATMLKGIVQAYDQIVVARFEEESSPVAINKARLALQTALSEDMLKFVLPSRSLEWVAWSSPLLAMTGLLAGAYGLFAGRVAKPVTPTTPTPTPPASTPSAPTPPGGTADLGARP